VLDALGNGEAATDMRTVFSWSYRTLSAEAARLFRGLGTQRGPDVDAAAAAALLRVSPGQASPLLAELAHAHMITEIAPGRYTVHGLLRAYAAELTRRLRASAPPRPAALGRARVYGHNVSRARLHRLHGREAHGRIRGGANVWH
jgi:hypothetical protein